MSGKYPGHYPRYGTAANPSSSYTSTNASGSNPTGPGAPYSSSVQARGASLAPGGGPSAAAAYSASGQGFPAGTYGAAHHTTPHHTTPNMSSPYTSSPSPGAAGSGGYYSPYAKGVAPPPLKKYTLQPPPKKLQLHRAMELGYPDIFPQRPNQDEDQLTESNVRNGFIDRPIVSNENTCAHDMVHGRLVDDPKILYDLGAFMVDVLKRKREASRITGANTFKPPNRATLNDVKKEQWMSELAGGVVLLRKLARNLPHGFKGEKLLESLAMKQVPLLRATWFIKAVGLSEMQSQRNKSVSQQQYTLDWTVNVTGFLKRQISEIVSPATTRVGPATGKAADGKAPWATEEGKERWEAKWLYSIRLAKWQYNEGLLEQRQFLKWTLDQLTEATNFEQTQLMLLVINEFLAEYQRNRTLMHLLIETVVNREWALLQHPAYVKGGNWRYGYLEKDLRRMIQSIFLSTPDMFIFPRLWSSHHPLLRDILARDTDTGPRHASSPQRAEFRAVMRRYYRMIRCRNELFCGAFTDVEDEELPADDTLATAGSHTGFGEEADEIDEEEVRMRVLDRIGANVGSMSGFDEIAGWYFGLTPGAPGQTTGLPESPGGAAGPEKAVFVDQLRTLCDWAVTVQRQGDWRVYVIGAMLLKWRDGMKGVKEEGVKVEEIKVEEGEEERERRRVAVVEKQQMVQDGLMKFLDGFGAGEGGRKDEEFDAVSRLFGELIRLGLFSYQRYLSRLIARGDLEPSCRADERSVRHLRYLQGFPLYRGQRYQLNQRRVMLYGVDGQDHQESVCFEALVHQIKKRLPHLFSPYAAEMTQPIVDDATRDFQPSFCLDAELVEALRSASRYCQVWVTYEWMLEAVTKFVVKNVQIGEDNWRVMTSPGSSLLNPRQFLTIIRVMEVAKDYSTLIEMTLWVLECTNERSLYPLVIDALRRHHVMWKLMGKQKDVFEALMNKHQALANRMMVERCLVIYMVQLWHEGYEVSESTKLQLQSDLQIKPISSTMLTHIPTHAPSIVQELTALLIDTIPSAASSVAVSLCYKYHTVPNWIGLILDTMTDILRRQSTETTETTAVPSDVLDGLDTGLDKAAATSSTTGTRFFNMRRTIGVFAEVLREIGERITLPGRLDEAVLDWLVAQCHTGVSGASTSSDNPGEMFRMDDSGMWFVHFLAMMVVRGVARLDVLVSKFCYGWLEKVGKRLKVQEMQQAQKSEDEETERMMRVCRNVVTLLRLVLVQEEARGGVLEVGGGGGEVGGDDWWLLNLEEIQALRTQRQFLGTLECLSLPFMILHQLAMIESCVALNHPVLHAVQVLRKDLVGVPWFREVCLGNAEAVYDKFMRMDDGVDEQNSQQQQQAQGGATGTAQEQNHLKEVKRKMVEVFQYVMGDGELESTNPNLHNSVSNYITRFKTLFSQINKWNLERSRVKFWLLLDRILLMPEGSDSDVHGDVVMHDAARPGGGGAIRRDECLAAFVQYFFDELVLGGGAGMEGEGRGRFVRRMLTGVRKEVVNELLRYGEAILSGSGATESTPFIDSILLTHAGSKTADHLSSDRYHQIVRAFYHVMHALMLEATSDTWTEERKMEFLKGLLAQIRRFEEGGKIYDVMHACNVSFADASKALQTANNNNLDAAIALLRTEGVVHEHGDNPPERSLMLQDIRVSLLVRLRLLVPLLSVIWHNPLRERCDILQWILVLVNLVCTTLVHGNGTQERFFEFVLDVVSVLMDEVPKELRKTNLTQLGTLQAELTIPTIFSSRIKRILPFQIHNVYMTNLKQTPAPSSATAMTPNPDASTMPTPQPQNAAALAAQQPRPWEWLEDFVSDNSVSENDVPISLAMFGARKIKRADATYVKWFKFGFGGAHDEEETASVRSIAPGVDDGESNARVKRIRVDPADIAMSIESSRSGSRVGSREGSVLGSRATPIVLEEEDGGITGTSEVKMAEVKMAVD